MQGESRKYSVVSLFSGCGGLDLGIEKTGRGDVIWANDYLEPAVETYRKNLGPRIVAGDIRTIDVPDVKCDVLVAGPPCQDFSVLWLHEGMRTARGNLYFEVLRFLDELAPPAFILENVRGLLSANSGEAWALIRSGLKNPARALGFPREDAPLYDLSVQVVNFADLGVPQTRERLIVIGTRKDLAVSNVEIPRPFLGNHLTSREALEGAPLPEYGELNHDLTWTPKQLPNGSNLSPPGPTTLRYRRAMHCR